MPPAILPEKNVHPEKALEDADPSCRFGKYIPLKELGSGGSGVVHMAWDTLLRQKVALKRIKLKPSDDVSAYLDETARLLEEARTGIQLQHPGIVRVFDVGVIDQTHYMSMEYIEGSSLGVRMDAAALAGQISPFHQNPADTLRLMSDVARALSYMHTRQVPLVHRDLKPCNIMVDTQGKPRLLDLGMCRSTETAPEDEGMICGTPSYMAPEQAQGRVSQIDARTDIYAFGAILHELLTGEPIFRGDPSDVLREVVSKPIVTPTERLEQIVLWSLDELRPQPIPPAVEAVCMRCLSKEKADRPQRMAEVALTLEKAALDLRFAKAKAPAVA